VAPSESGLASGVINTAFMMGGALGLAILASLAAARTEGLRGAGVEAAAALNGGYHAAFVAGAIFAIVAAIIGAVLFRTTDAPAAEHIEAAQAAVPVEVGVCD
jgi:sugar phosphate permease